jgi:hypothetical protein
LQLVYNTYYYKGLIMNSFVNIAASATSLVAATQIRLIPGAAAIEHLARLVFNDDEDEIDHLQAGLGYLFLAAVVPGGDLIATALVLLDGSTVTAQLAGGGYLLNQLSRLL